MDYIAYHYRDDGTREPDHKVEPTYLVTMLMVLLLTTGLPVSPEENPFRCPCYVLIPVRLWNFKDGGS